jgi:hypothetical protein
MYGIAAHSVVPHLALNDDGHGLKELRQNPMADEVDPHVGPAPNAEEREA